MQAGAAQLGITIRPMAIEWPAKVQAYSAQETAPDVGTVWMFPSLPDPDQFYGRLGHSSQGGGGGVNFSWFSNADNDALVEAGRVELDPEARCEIYKQVQEIWDAETPYVNVVVGMASFRPHTPTSRAISGRLHIATRRMCIRSTLTICRFSFVVFGAMPGPSAPLAPPAR